MPRYLRPAAPNSLRRTWGIDMTKQQLIDSIGDEILAEFVACDDFASAGGIKIFFVEG